MHDGLVEPLEDRLDGAFDDAGQHPLVAHRPLFRVFVLVLDDASVACAGIV